MSSFLHTMIRVGDLQRSVDFYTKLLGMKELRRRDVPDGKYTLAFVGYGDEGTAEIELTYNYGIDALRAGDGVRPPGDRRAGCGGDLREGPQGRRQGDARGGAGEVRHHGHRVRRGPGRLQDRTGAAELVVREEP